ncbi:MAG TPA: protein-export chaperone SecB [Caulobacteraceae bacterium]|nr:protein-export chaperone SecB [Caulobacteraceae bacterium]
MTDTNTGAPPPGGLGDPGQGPGIRVLAQFIRDLSFENPHAPDSLNMGSNAPQMDVGVEMNGRTRNDGLFEVDLKLTASAQREGSAVFHCELLYGGLFQITGVPESEMELVLLTECPRYLFPFARHIVSEMSAQGGFPPFMLDPIDFMGIYMAQKGQGQLATSPTSLPQ